MYYETKSSKEGSTIHSETKQQLVLGLVSIIFMFICSHFALNIFIGIVISAFNRGKEQVTRLYLLSKFQKTYLTYQEIVIKIKPIRKLELKSEFREKMKRIVDHKVFDRFIFVALIVNSTLLCFKWYDMRA